MKVTILQLKPTLGDVEKNFENFGRWIKGAAEYGADTVILPELWSTGYYPTPVENFADKNCERTKKFIGELAKSCGVNIVAGSVIAQVKGKIFNRSLIFNRRGRLLTFYDKAHLFSFAGEEKIFSAGNKIKTFELDGVKCGIAICYDLRFPEFIRQIALEGIEILFCPAAWSLKRILPRQFLSKARAIENQIFVVFANSSGISEILNPLGDNLAVAGVGEQMLSATIDLNFRAEVISKMNLLADRNLFTDSFKV